MRGVKRVSRPWNRIPLNIVSSVKPMPSMTRIMLASWAGPAKPRNQDVLNETGSEATNTVNASKTGGSKNFIPP